MNRAALMLICGVALSACTGAVIGSRITGRAHVVDGDTVDVVGVRVRLQGVAAPELDERGGRAAQRYLHERVERR